MGRTVSNAIIHPGLTGNYCSKTPAGKAKYEAAVAKFEEDTAHLKIPKPDLGSDQNISQSGETVPIVFCKHELAEYQPTPRNDKYIGGVWLSPSAVKTFSVNFDQGAIFPICQGEIAQEFTPGNIYIGKVTAYSLDSSFEVFTRFYTQEEADADTYGYFYPIPTSRVKRLSPSYFHYSAYLGVWYNNDPNGQDFNGKKAEHSNVGPAKLYVGGNNLAWRANGTTTHNTHLEVAQDIFDNVDNAYVSLGGVIRFSFGGTENNWQRDQLEYPEAVRNRDWPSGSYTYYRVYEEPYWSGRFKFISTFYSYENHTFAYYGEPADTAYITEVHHEYTQDYWWDYGYSYADTRSAAGITWVGTVGRLFEQGAANKQHNFYISEGAVCTLYSEGVDVQGNYSSRGASSNFHEYAYYLIQLYKGFTGSAEDMLVAPIDVNNAENLGVYYEGNMLKVAAILSSSVNAIEYLSDIASYFLSELISTNGKYKVKLLEPFTGDNLSIDPLENPGAFYSIPIPPNRVYSDDDILEGSYQKFYIAPSDRKNRWFGITYRNADKDSPGKLESWKIAPIGTPLSAPVSSFDASELIGDFNTAFLATVMQMVRGIHTEYNVQFQTTLDKVDGLEPGDLIRLDLERTNSTGDDGRELSNLIQITDIAYSQSGEVAINAVHFPTRPDGSSWMYYYLDTFDLDYVG